MEENDMPYNLEEQLKKLEIEKNIQEVQKTKKEIEKIQAETNLINKPWWRKPETFILFLGIPTILGFYITYIVEPVLKKDMIELSLKNAQVSDSLYHVKIKSNIREKRLDSLQTVLIKRDNELLKAYKELKRISKLKNCSDLQKQLKKFKVMKPLTGEEIMIEFSKMNSSGD